MRQLLSLAMGLTTILTPLVFVHRNTPMCKKHIFNGNWTCGDVLDTLPMSGVKGSRVQAGEAWDSLSMWKYAIQAASQEMTARPAGEP